MYDVESKAANSTLSQYEIRKTVSNDIASQYSIRKTVTNSQKIIDVSTATYDNKLFSIGEFIAPTGVAFNADKSKMWSVGKDDLFAYQYSLSTPGDVTTATYDNKK